MEDLAEREYLAWVRDFATGNWRLYLRSDVECSEVNDSPSPPWKSHFGWILLAHGNDSSLKSTAVRFSMLFRMAEVEFASAEHSDA